MSCNCNDNGPIYPPVTNCVDADLPEGTPCTSTETCEEVIDAGCVQYNGDNLPQIGVLKRDRLDAILAKLNLNTGTNPIAVEDTNSIDLSGNGLGGTPLIADVKLDPDTHNLTVITDDGLLTKVNDCMIQDIISLINSSTTLHDLFCSTVVSCAAGYCGSATDFESELDGTSFILTWTPFTANSLSQVIQYKKLSDAAWTDAATVGSAVDTYNLGPVALNTIYQIRIQTNCSIGGPTYSSPDVKSTSICPTVSIIPTYSAIAYNFSYVPNDYKTITVELLLSDDTVVGTKVFTFTTNDYTLVSGSFIDLDPETDFVLKMTFSTTLGTEYNLICTNDTATLEAPSCSVPTTPDVEME